MDGRASHPVREFSRSIQRQAGGLRPAVWFGAAACAALAAVLLLMPPAVCLGQAMGKASVEMPTEPVAASRRVAEVPATAPAVRPAAAGPAAPSPAAGTAGERAAAVDGPPNPALTIPIEARKTDTPAAPESVPAAPAAAATTGPAEATTAPATTNVGLVHRAIESAPIRPTAPAPAPAAGDVPQAKTSGAGLGGLGSAVQVGGALAVVLGLIWIGRTLARKYLPGAAASGGKGVIEILARYPLAKNQSLVLVRIGSQIVVLNQGREASQSILVINEQSEVAGILGQIQGTKPHSIQAGFSKLLANARVELESGDGAEDAGGAEANRALSVEDLDRDLDEMAAAKRQLMDLRAQVRSVRESLPLR